MRKIIISIIYIALVGFMLPSGLLAEGSTDATNDEVSRKAVEYKDVEIRVVEFLEQYPYGWKGVSDGGRLYWNPLRGGAGFFIGGELVRMIPRNPLVFDFAMREVENRLRYTGQFNSPVVPVGLALPRAGDIDLSLSDMTLWQYRFDLRNAHRQSLTRAYAGFKFFPRTFDLTQSLSFILGLDILVGYEHGNLQGNRMNAHVSSPFAAIEPNLEFKYLVAKNVGFSLLLPVRLLWASPVPFYTGMSKRLYSTDFQRGVAFSVSVRY